MEGDFARPRAGEAVGTSSRSSVSVVKTGGQAALARAERPRIFFPVRERRKNRVEQAAPGNYPARCFVQGSVRLI